VVGDWTIGSTTCGCDQCRAYRYSQTSSAQQQSYRHDDGTLVLFKQEEVAAAKATFGDLFAIYFKEGNNW
jgi:hypothetical protein